MAARLNNPSVKICGPTHRCWFSQTLRISLERSGGSTWWATGVHDGSHLLQGRWNFQPENKMDQNGASKGLQECSENPAGPGDDLPHAVLHLPTKNWKNHNKLLNFHEVPPLKVKVCPTVIVLYSCSWHVEASQNFRSQVLSSMAVQSTIPRRFPSARDDLWGFGWTMQEKPRCIPFCEHVTCWSYKLLKRNILLRPILFDDVWLYFTLLLAKSNVSLVSPILLDAYPLVHVQTMTQNIHTLSQNSPKCPLTIIKVDAVSFRYLLHSCCLHPCCLDHDIDFYGYIILYN